MSADLHNAVKRIVAGLLSTMPVPRRGTIDSVNPATMQAKVLVQPENALTGWLPIASMTLGNGWGVVSPPVPGTQCVVLPVDGDAMAGVVIACHYSQQQQPPTSAAGEIRLVHQSGSFARLTNDGQVMLQDASGASITLTNNGTAVVDAALHVTGAVVAGYGGADQVGVQTHTHTQSADSHGDTEEPTNAPTPGT